MGELWIPITITAAFFQNLRSVLQKQLKEKLSLLGAAYVRFFYALPFSLLYLWILNEWGNIPYPSVNLRFLVFCFFGGISQIIFTVLLIWMFSFRNFAVGTIFSKTEVVQVAILGFLLLGDPLTLQSLIAIGICVIGVCVLSLGGDYKNIKGLICNMTEKPTIIGLASGLFLGASVVFFRGASLSLEFDNAIMSAAYTLLISIMIQTVIMGAYLTWRKAGEFNLVIRYWRSGLQVGFVASLASICWFLAFTLENAAFVRALGQIELVFTFIASLFFFREKILLFESFGIILIVSGILILVLN